MALQTTWVICASLQFISFGAAASLSGYRNTTTTSSSSFRSPAQPPSTGSSSSYVSTSTSSAGLAGFIIQGLGGGSTTSSTVSTSSTTIAIPSSAVSTSSSSSASSSTISGQSGTTSLLSTSSDQYATSLSNTSALGTSTSTDGVPDVVANTSASATTSAAVLTTGGALKYSTASLHNLTTTSRPYLGFNYSSTPTFTLPSTGIGLPYANACNAEWQTFSSVATITEHVTNVKWYTTVNFTATVSTYCNTPSYDYIVGDLVPTATGSFLTNATTAIPYGGPTPSCSISPSDCVSLRSAVNPNLEYQVQCATTSLPVSVEDCGPCYIHGGKVEMYYFPVSANKTQDPCPVNAGKAGVNCPYGQWTPWGDPVALPGELQTTCSLYSTNYSSTRNSGPYIVDSGTTFYSNRVYISLETAYATNSCGRVGKDHTGTMVTLKTKDVYSVCNGFNTHTDYATWFNFQDLNYPVPAFAYGCMCDTGNDAVGVLTAGDYVNGVHYPSRCAPVVQSYYRPTLAVPPQIRSLDPAWAACSLDLDGLYDPPIALTTTSAAAGLSSPVFTTASPVPTLSSPTVLSTASGTTGTPTSPSSSPTVLSTISKTDAVVANPNSYKTAPEVVLTSDSLISVSTPAFSSTTDDAATVLPDSAQSTDGASSTSGSQSAQSTISSDVASGSSTDTEEPLTTIHFTQSVNGTKPPILPPQILTTTSQEAAVVTATFKVTSSLDHNNVGTAQTTQTAQLDTLDPAYNPPTASDPGTSIQSIADPGGVIASLVGQSTSAQVTSFTDPPTTEVFTFAGVTHTAVNSGGSVFIDGSTTNDPVNSASVATSPVVAETYSNEGAAASTVTFVANGQTYTAIKPSGTSSVLLVDGSTLSEGAIRTLNGVTASLGSTGLVVGSSLVASFQDPPAPTAQAVVTIGSQTVTAVQQQGQGSANAIVIGSATLTPGGAGTTIDGHAVSAASDGLVVGSSTHAVAHTQALPQFGTVVTIGSQTLAAVAQQGAGPASAIVVAGATLFAGGAGTTINGATVSAAVGGLVVGSSTVAISRESPSATSQAILTVGGQTLTAVAQPQSGLPTAIVVAGATLSPGGPATTFHGTVISAASNGAILVGSQTIPLSAAITPSQVVVTLDGQVFTAQASSGAGGATVVVGSTLSPGGPPATISGAVLSAASQGLVIGGTETIAFTTLAQPAMVFTLSGQAHTALESAGGVLVVDGSVTLTPGGSATTVSGAVYSAASSGLVIDGSSTVSVLSAHAATTLTLEGQPFTASAAGSNLVVLDGSVTLSPGGSATVVSGHTLSAGSDGMVIDGQSTTTLSANVAETVTVGQHTLTASTDSGGRIVVDSSATLLPGGPATTLTDGAVVSAAQNGGLGVDGATTVSLVGATSATATSSSTPTASASAQGTTTASGGGKVVAVSAKLTWLGWFVALAAYMMG